MYWIQTKNNLNNILEVVDIFRDCYKKKISQILIGNEGPYQWLEIEKFKRENKINVQVIYALYKKHKYINVLWAIKGDVLKNAGLLENAYETKNFSNINQNIVLPIIIPKKETKIEEGKKCFLKILNQIGDAYIGKTDENKEIVNQMVTKSQKRVLPLQRVRFLEPIDKEITDIRRKINGETNIDDNYNLFFKPEKFLEQEFQKTKKVLSQIKGYIKWPKTRKMELWDKKLIEQTPVPQNWEIFFSRHIKLPENQWEQKKIHLLCINAGKGFNCRYKGKKNEKSALQQLKNELAVVVEGKFYDYFLVVADIYRFAREKNIRIFQRGSVVGSVLAYCLGITSFDPLVFDLKFERFLNPYRANKPDIDIEVPSSNISTIMKYLEEKYGKESITKLVSFNSFGIKNAIKCVRLELGIDEEIEKFFPKGIKDIDKFYATPEGKKIKLAIKKKGYNQVIEYARRISSLPRNTSVQQASIVLSDEVSNIPTKLEGEERVCYLSTSNQEIEEIGFNKIDILSSKTLETIEKAWSYLDQKERKKFNYCDKKTYRLLGEGNKNYVFQLKSKGIQDTFEAIKPRNLEDIMIGLALYRPGTKSELQHFLTNKVNEQLQIKNVYGKNIPGTEILIDIVKSTNGIIIFQEQVIEIVQKWAGYTIGEADFFRHIISKKDEGAMKKEKDKFIERSNRVGRNTQSTIELYELIERFSLYGYGKSHAASYAFLTYETAYLKANHPKAFFAAELNLTKNSRTIKEIISELKTLGIPVFKPNFYISKPEFFVENNGISYGVNRIKGLNKEEINKIISLQTKYKNKPLTKTELEQLDKSLLDKLNKIQFFNKY